MLRLSNYWALGFLLLIPYTFYLSKKSLADLSTWRRWSAFGLRSIIILLLVLSLAGFMLVWKVDNLCVIFALDTSGSIPAGEVERASGFMNRAVAGLQEDDKAGVVVFGDVDHHRHFVRNRRHVIVGHSQGDRVRIERREGILDSHAGGIVEHAVVVQVPLVRNDAMRGVPVRS